MKSKVLLLLFCSFLIPGSAQIPLNGSFEHSQGERVAGWAVSDMSNAFVYGLDKKVAKAGKASYFMDGNALTERGENIRCNLAAMLNLSKLKGIKQLEIRGWVKGECEDSAYTIFCYYTSTWTPDIRVLNPSAPNGDWKPFQYTFDLSPADTLVYVGAEMSGKGKVWLDGLELWADGKKLKDSYLPIKIKDLKGKVAWLETNLHPLSGADSGLPKSELEALGKAIGNADLVGVGEPTHGTSEAFRFKKRMLEYLVEEKGFNTFLLEDELPEAGLVQDYISGKTDSLVPILKKYFFPVWQNQELVDLINWMRDYNKSHDKKLMFRGIDMQSIRVATAELKRLAQKSGDDQLVADLLALKKMQWRYFQTGNPPLVKDSLVELSKQIDRHFQNRKTDYLNAVGPDSMLWFTQNMTIIQQHIPNIDWGMGINYRDSCMAANIEWIMTNYPGTRALIWAHNSHVQNSMGWMGACLRNALGRRYFALGVLTAEGEYTASLDFAKTVWKRWPLEKPYVGSFEFMLSKAQQIDYYILLNEKWAKDVRASWLSTPADERGIGFMKVDQQLSPAEPLTNRYDGVVFFRKTGASRSFKFKD